MQTTKTDLDKLTRSALLGSFLRRFFFFAASWVVLLDGKKPDDLWLVALFLTAATAISIYTVPPGKWRLRPLAAVRFLIYFITAAVRGGWDVAKRVFVKKVPIDPAFIPVNHYRDPLKTLLFTWVISLQPGTTSCEIKERTIVIHVLDKNIPIEQDIRKLQERIDKLFVKG